MSPARARTSTAAIVAAGRELLEERGLEAVTMATVAARVGIRPPSLYKHVRDRSELLAAMLESAAMELGSVLASAPPVPGTDPSVRVAAIADAYRAFVRRAPRASAMLFADLGPDLAPPQEQLALAARPVIEAAAALVGDRDALPAARALTAFAHGFTSMESAGAFRLGGDVDEAYRTGVEALIRGLATRNDA